MEAALATEYIEELQSNLEEKDNPNIMKDDSASRKVSSLFTSIAPLTVIINTTRKILVNFYPKSIKN